MRRVLMAAAAAAVIGIASPAAASITVTVDQTGTPLQNPIYGDPGATNNQDAVTVYGSAPNNNNADNVTFTGDSALHITNGFAQLSDGGTISGDLHNIIINPDDIFSAFEFATQLSGEGATVYVYYLLSGSGLNPNAFSSYFCGTSVCGLAGNYNSGPHDNANYILSGANFDGFLLATTSSISFFQAKQLSYNGALAPVPEPATWGLMLLGFGGIGLAMRRRRRNGRLLQVA